MAELRARHAFGNSSGIDAALEAKKIDAFDILLLDGNTNEPKVGWIDKNGNKVIVKDKAQIVRVDSLPTENGDPNVLYVYNNLGYIWDEAQTKCVPVAEGADITELETKVTTLETEIAKKVDEQTVDNKIAAMTGLEIVEF